MDEERVSAELAVAGLFRKPNSEILLVSREGFWSLPVGHLKPGEDVIKALFREIGEELGIYENDFSVGDSLGTAVLSKNGGPTKSIEIRLCKIGFKASKRIRYKEKDENVLVWLKPREAKNLSNLDPLGNEGVTRYLIKYPLRKGEKHDERSKFQGRLADCQI